MTDLQAKYQKLAAEYSKVTDSTTIASRQKHQDERQRTHLCSGDIWISSVVI